MEVELGAGEGGGVGAELWRGTMGDECAGAVGRPDELHWELLLSGASVAQGAKEFRGSEDGNVWKQRKNKYGER